MNFNESNVSEPPLTKNLTDEEVQYIVTEPIRFKHPCHSQAVKRHMRLVTEASRVASTFKRRDGFIRQRIRSQKLIKRCDLKQDILRLYTYTAWVEY